MTGRTGVVVAARSGSRRLPGKALLPLGGEPMIAFLLRRLRGAGRADVILLATTALGEDDRLAEVASREGVPVFRGEGEDVVRRYVEAAEEHGIDRVVRVTGDCPFVDAETLDYCLESCEGLGGFDLATTKGAFPVGIDYEIFPAEVMAGLDARAPLSAFHREHLTAYIYDHPARFRLRVIEPDPRWLCPGRAFTVDTAEDYRAATALVTYFGRSDFSAAELMEAARHVH